MYGAVYYRSFNLPFGFEYFGENAFSPKVWLPWLSCLHEAKRLETGKEVWLCPKTTKSLVRVLHGRQKKSRCNYFWRMLHLRFCGHCCISFLLRKNLNFYVVRLWFVCLFMVLMMHNTGETHFTLQLLQFEYCNYPWSDFYYPLVECAALVPTSTLKFQS